MCPVLVKAGHGGRRRRLVDHISSAHWKEGGSGEGERVLAGIVVRLRTPKSHFGDVSPPPSPPCQQGCTSKRVSVTSPVSVTDWELSVEPSQQLCPLSQSFFANSLRISSLLPGLDLDFLCLPLLLPSLLSELPCCI